MYKKELFKLQDLKYRDFHSKLIPTVDRELVIGVRVPEIKKLAKDIFKRGDYKSFLESVPHKYYEENNLHAFLIEQIKDYDECMAETEKFLPYIDNWATCDSLRPKVFKKNLPKLICEVKRWIKSENTFTVRFAVEMLMCYYLDNEFKIEYAEMVANIKSQDYYVNMMLSWYFTTALFKQYDAALPYIVNNKLGDWVHNKTIQKAVESYRITEDKKRYLKSLRRK